MNGFVPCGHVHIPPLATASGLGARVVVPCANVVHMCDRLKKCSSSNRDGWQDHVCQEVQQYSAEKSCLRSTVEETTRFSCRCVHNWC